MPELGPDEAAQVDAALADWRQGDVALDANWCFYAADGDAALTPEGAEAGPGTNIIQVSTEGAVVLTQTCDIVRPCLARPFIELAPLVEVTEEVAHEIERGYRPNYAIVPALRAARLVADLDRTTTVEKPVLASWSRTPGWTTDEQARAFARGLARKRVRFAFPDDFNGLVRPLQSRILEKHDKGSDEGRALRALREIRVTASPSWDAPASVELFFSFVRNDAEPTFKGTGWDSYLEKWLKLVPPSGRFTAVEGVVLTLGDMTAQEYVDSDALDLDYLSSRDEGGER